MRSRVADRWQQEKQIVSLMISIYCRKRHRSRGGLCPKCAALEEASDVLLWETRHFVQTAKYTVIHRK